LNSAKETAENVGETLRKKASDAGEQVKRSASDAGEQVKRSASDAGEKVKSAAQNAKKQAEAQGGTLLDQVFNVFNNVKDSVLGKNFLKRKYFKNKILLFRNIRSSIKTCS
jgi:gas vesicle protein